MTTDTPDVLALREARDRVIGSVMERYHTVEPGHPQPCPECEDIVAMFLASEKVVRAETLAGSGVVSPRWLDDALQHEGAHLRWDAILSVTTVLNNALAATPPTPALTAARLAEALMGTSMWRYLQQSASGDPMTADEWRTYAERNAADILAALATRGGHPMTTDTPDVLALREALLANRRSTYTDWWFSDCLDTLIAAVRAETLAGAGVVEAPVPCKECGQPWVHAYHQTPGPKHHEFHPATPPTPDLTAARRATLVDALVEIRDLLSMRNAPTGEHVVMAWNVAVRALAATPEEATR